MKANGFPPLIVHLNNTTLLLGFSALHEDIDSPRQGRRLDATNRSPGSGRDVPMVAAEDLSKSLSSLNESTGRTGTDPKASTPPKTAQKDKLPKEST